MQLRGLLHSPPVSPNEIALQSARRLARGLGRAARLSVEARLPALALLVDVLALLLFAVLQSNIVFQVNLVSDDGCKEQPHLAPIGADGRSLPLPFAPPVAGLVRLLRRSLALRHAVLRALAPLGQLLPQARQF